MLCSLLLTSCGSEQENETLIPTKTAEGTSEEKTEEENKEALYAGIPYQSKGFGNVSRWLEYYDEETADEESKNNSEKRYERKFSHIFSFTV